MNKLAVVIVAALATLGTVGCTSDVGHETKKAQEVAAQRNDKRAALAIRAAVGPQRIRCDAGTRNLKFFDSTTGEPRLFYYVEEDNQRYLCFDGPGYDSLTQGELKPVDKDAVYKILNQAAPQPPPVPIVVTPPLPVVTATPFIPILDQGPCCGR